MPGQQLAHMTKECGWRRGVIQRYKVGQGIIVNRPLDFRILKNSLNFLSKQKAVRKLGIEQRLHTETVSYNPQSALSLVPETERKHAVETLETLNAPFLIRL